MSINSAEELLEESSSIGPRHGLFRADSLKDEIRHICLRPSSTAATKVSTCGLFGCVGNNSDEELDALMSLLFNNKEKFGPLQAYKDLFKLLPSQKKTVDLRTVVEKGAQCTVCMDDFHIQDKTKCLPCKHLYHERCIEPWLKKHTTCPNCSVIIKVQSKEKRESDKIHIPEHLVEYYRNLMDPFHFLY